MNTTSATVILDGKVFVAVYAERADGIDLLEMRIGGENVLPFLSQRWISRALYECEFGSMVRMDNLHVPSVSNEAR